MKTKSEPVLTAVMTEVLTRIFDKTSGIDGLNSCFLYCAKTTFAALQSLTVRVPTDHKEPIAGR